MLLQAFLGGRRVRIRMDIYLHEGEWDEIRQAARIPKDREKETRVNAIIGKYRGRVEEMFYDARMSGSALSPERFADELDNKPTLDLLVSFMQKEIEKERGDKEESTVKQYNSTLKHLREFRPSATLSDVTFDFVQEFDRFLRRKNLSTNSRAKYHTLLRKFMLLAKKKRPRIQNPYEHFKVRSVPTDRTWLSVEEVHNLVSIYRSGTLGTTMQQSLRQFLFQVVASVRVGDIRRLTRENIHSDMLVFSPKKGRRFGKAVAIPLSALALDLISEGGGTNGRLFAEIADQTVNTNLKEIARIAAISKRLTTHVGRHTFGFLYLLMGGKVEELREIMGHSKLETTMIYTHTDHDKKVAGMRKFDEVFRVR